MGIRDRDIFGRMGPLGQEQERFSSVLAPDREALDEGNVWSPPVDIYERDDSLVLLIDLPGLKREEIDLHVDSNTLTIQGERAGAGGGAGLRLERPSGRFRRSFRVGLPIDPDKVRASYRAGVLKITMPRIGAPGPARVPIDTG